jgi:hypothetical protein
MAMHHEIFAQETIRTIPVLTFDAWLNHNGFTWETHEDHCEYVDRIIALQISIYMLRRNRAVDGSILDDGLYPLLSEARQRYLEKFGIEYPDPNDDKFY